VTNPKNEGLKDLTPRELATFIPLVALAIWIGVYPKPFFQILDQPVQQLVRTVRGPDFGKPKVENAQVTPVVEPVKQTVEGGAVPQEKH
jgi:NADH-quinone oxidoreductase subunit M